MFVKKNLIFRCNILILVICVAFPITSNLMGLKTINIYYFAAPESKIQQ